MKKNKVIHLCGLGPGWSLCPPMKEGRMIWGINNILNRRKVNYVFEIHDFHDKLNRLRGGHVHQKAIRLASRYKIPYIVRERWSFLPHLTQIVYPWEKIYEEFQTDHIGCSLDAMIALALYCGYTDLQMYGNGANLASIYDYQLPTNNYWVGVCHGRPDVNITFHNIGGLRHTDILRTVDGKVYGLDIPQREWPTIDPTLPECDCTKRHGLACSDF